MLVLPADHLVRDDRSFALAVAKAGRAAASGKLVTFGIQPEYAETGFGYIELAGNSSTGQVHPVVRFVEKPSLEVAEEYLSGGKHLWNSGMFCFRVGSMLDELSKYSPNLLQGVGDALGAARRSEGDSYTVTALCADHFSRVEDISIDYALMEKSGDVSVVHCSFGWSDVGSWQAMAQLVEADDSGNRVEGIVELEDVDNVYIRSPHRLTAAVGVENLMIIDSHDALLVMHKNRCQDVKKIVQRLKSSGSELHHDHLSVHRPWGVYTILEKGERFKIKRIEVKPGASLSLQLHYHRSEHWIVVSGTANVVNGSERFLLSTNESTYIPAGHKHRLENPGTIPLVMIEVQSGEYLGEDDILRFEDTYGRC